MTVEPFTHHVNPGTTHDGRVFVTIKWNGTRLSITGVEGPKANGDAKGGAGQITYALRDLTSFADGWDVNMTTRLALYWDLWHLNDMRAGCEHQRAMGWKYDDHPSKPCPTCGYRMGSAWLHEDVPADVIEWLHDLPTSDDLPTAWQ